MSAVRKRILTLIIALVVIGAFVSLYFWANGVFMTIFPILIAILVFCVIIMIHELGHFIAAKACGIYVKEFSFGMGPALFRKKGKETEYLIRAFPVGGYCSFEADIEEFDENADEEKKPEPNPRAFNRKPVWQRIIVVLCGPIMNLILGFIVVIISTSTADVLASTTVCEFREQSVSSNSLMLNDEILSIDGLSIFSINDVFYKLQNGGRMNENGSAVFDFDVLRNGEKVHLKDVEFGLRQSENPDAKPTVIFDFKVYRLNKDFPTIISESFRETVSISRRILLVLFDMLGGKYGLNDLSGPIGTGSIITEAVSKLPTNEYTISDFLSIVSMISINVGIFNILPIPGLDGCRLIFLIIELFRRKPIDPRVEGMVHFIGFALLFLLLIIITVNDVSKLIAPKGGT